MLSDFLAKTVDAGGGVRQPAVDSRSRSSESGILSDRKGQDGAASLLELRLELMMWSAKWLLFPLAVLPAGALFTDQEAKAAPKAPGGFASFNPATQ